MLVGHSRWRGSADSPISLGSSKIWYYWSLYPVLLCTAPHPNILLTVPRMEVFLDDVYSFPFQPFESVHTDMEQPTPSKLKDVSNVIHPIRQSVSPAVEVATPPVRQPRGAYFTAWTLFGHVGSTEIDSLPLPGQR